MFLEDLFIETMEKELERLVCQSTSSCGDTRFSWDLYIAKSLLQKSVRRGDHQRAQTAAGALLRASEYSFWKRLSVIALEDVGIANIRLCTQVLLAAKSPALRQNLGGTTAIAPALVSALCSSPKDRSTDDLIDAVASNVYDSLRAEYADLTQSALFQIAASQTAPVVSRALAGEILCRGGAEEIARSFKTDNWLKLLHRLPESVLSPCVGAVTAIGLQRTKSIMAPYLALLSRDAPVARVLSDDDYPEELEIEGLPSWALDGHTRLGLQSFRLYRRRSARLCKYLHKWSSGTVSPAKTIAGLVFRSESAQLSNRLDWPTGKQLKAEACGNRPGLKPGAAAEGLAIVAEEFTLVNECRAEAVRVYLR